MDKSFTDFFMPSQKKQKAEKIGLYNSGKIKVLNPSAVYG
jgi:hypothetical protein